MCMIHKVIFEEMSFMHKNKTRTHFVYVDVQYSADCVCQQEHMRMRPNIKAKHFPSLSHALTKHYLCCLSTIHEPLALSGQLKAKFYMIKQ